MKSWILLSCALCSLSAGGAAAQESFAPDTACQTGIGETVPRLFQMPGRWRIVSVDFVRTHSESGKDLWSVREVTFMGLLEGKEPLVLVPEHFVASIDTAGKQMWQTALPASWRTVLGADELVICAERGVRSFQIVFVKQEQKRIWCQVDPYGGFADPDRTFATFSPDVQGDEHVRCFRARD